MAYPLMPHDRRTQSADMIPTVEMVALSALGMVLNIKLFLSTCLLWISFFTHSLSAFSFRQVFALIMILRSGLLLGTLVLSLLSRGAANDRDYIRYTTITGYFLQDDNATDSSKFDYVSCNGEHCLCRH